jgi:hypothetical protein
VGRAAIGPPGAGRIHGESRRATIGILRRGDSSEDSSERPDQASAIATRRFVGRFVGTAYRQRVPDPRPPEKPDDRRESDETELEDAARQEAEYPADETNEG